MSTVALWSADAATSEAKPKAGLGLFQRLVQAREKEAMRRIHYFLASHSDARLMDLGYGPEEIQAIRQGRLTKRSG